MVPLRNDLDLTKLPEESELDYHKRLVYGKMVDGTLSDFDYAELSPFLYGKEYSSDNTRKMLYGSCKTLELMDREGLKTISKQDVLNEIEAKTFELKKERQRMFDQRREYNKLSSLEGRQEHLYESLIDAANKLSTTVGKVYPISVNPMGAFGELGVPISDNEAVLVFSDWHYGLKVKNIFNEYDTQICKERVNAVVTSAAERIALHGCQTLHIFVLGDLYHGAIHVGARVASEELVCDQLMQVSEILAQSIEYLSHYVQNVKVYVTYGNHARTVQNKNDSIHRDNMERVVPWWLKARFASYGNNKIEVVEDDGTEFIFANPCGHGICASHGDNDSVKASPRLMTTLFHKRYGKDVEYIIQGDKHHRESFEEMGIESVMCGSLCGTDDYANDRRLYSTPSQLLLIVNPEIGIDAEYRLKCA